MHRAEFETLFENFFTNLNMRIYEIIMKTKEQKFTRSMKREYPQALSFFGSGNNVGRQTVCSE